VCIVSRWPLPYSRLSRFTSPAVDTNCVDGPLKEVAQEKDWIDTMSKDLEDIKITWEEAKEVATERTLYGEAVLPDVHGTCVRHGTA